MSGYYKRPPFRFQKVAFYMQKDGLLHPERMPFGKRQVFFPLRISVFCIIIER